MTTRTRSDHQQLLEAVLAGVQLRRGEAGGAQGALTHAGCAHAHTEPPLHPHAHPAAPAAPPAAALPPNPAAHLLALEHQRLAQLRAHGRRLAARQARQPHAHQPSPAPAVRTGRGSRVPGLGVRGGGGSHGVQGRQSQGRQRARGGGAGGRGGGGRRGAAGPELRGAGGGGGGGVCGGGSHRGREVHTLRRGAQRMFLKGMEGRSGWQGAHAPAAALRCGLVP